MEITHLGELEDWLEALIRLGVDEFECPLFKVKFRPGATTLEEQVTYTRSDAKASAIPEPKSMFESPSLWPGGSPPKFTTRDKP